MIRQVLGGLRTVLLAIAVVCIALVGATTVSALAAAIATGSPGPALGLLGVLGVGLLSARALWLRALSTTGGDGHVDRHLPSPEFATGVNGGDALPPVAPTEAESVRTGGTDTEWTAREALSRSEQRAYDTLTRDLHDVERELEAATRRLDADEPAAALDRLAETDTALRNAKSRARRHDLTRVTRRIGRLWTRYRHIQKEAAAAREISDADARHLSDAQLDYNDIERGDRIGGDGTTDLYRATVDTGSRTEIAVREFTVDRETAERVHEGIETWGRLDDHDHVVRVLDHGDEPRPWVVTEYTDAGHLGERAGDLPFAQAVWTALATTEAVRHAHRRGVTHLQLEPRDVRFRSVDGGWDAPMVAGWARPAQSRGYGAPEQFDPDRYGSAGSVTDVYRLGAVCYELFTGRPPFEHHATGIESRRPPPPSAVADVPGPLDDVLLTALAAEKTDRYDHVLSLQEKLQTLRDSPGGGERPAGGRPWQSERVRSLDNV
jgi:hypothetical protein